MITFRNRYLVNQSASSPSNAKFSTTKNMRLSWGLVLVLAANYPVPNSRRVKRCQLANSLRLTPRQARGRGRHSDRQPTDTTRRWQICTSAPPALTISPAVFDRPNAGGGADFPSCYLASTYGDGSVNLRPTRVLSATITLPLERQLEFPVENQRRAAPPFVKRSAAERNKRGGRTPPRVALANLRPRRAAWFAWPRPTGSSGCSTPRSRCDAPGGRLPPLSSSDP